MNRSEFMFQLAQLIADLSFDERQEALKYYNDYFDEAGAENEAAVIEELVSPEKVAASIKAGLSGDDLESGEFTERGFEKADSYNDFEAPQSFEHGQQKSGFDQFSDKLNEFSDKFQKKAKEFQQKAEQRRQTRQDNDYSYGESRQYTQEDETGKYGGDQYGGSGYDGGQQPVKRNTGKIVLIIILCVCALPIAFGLFGGVFGIIIGLIGGIFGLFVAVCVAALGFLVSGCAMFGAGIAQCFASPASGLAISGAGLIVLAIGILLLVLVVFLIGRVIPAILRGIVKLCRKPFERRNKV